MEFLSNSRDVFAQLATTDPTAGVKVIIENHNALDHNDTLINICTQAIHRLQLQSRNTDPRVARQRERLQKLVVAPKNRTGAAGLAS